MPLPLAPWIILRIEVFLWIRLGSLLWGADSLPVWASEMAWRNTSFHSLSSSSWTSSKINSGLVLKSLKSRIARHFTHRLASQTSDSFTVGWQEVNIQLFLGLNDTKPVEIADYLLLFHSNCGKSFGRSSENFSVVKMERESHNLNKGNPRGLQEVKIWWEILLHCGRAYKQPGFSGLTDKTSCFGWPLNSFVQFNRHWNVLVSDHMIMNFVLCLSSHD